MTLPPSVIEAVLNVEACRDHAKAIPVEQWAGLIATEAIAALLSGEVGGPWVATTESDVLDGEGVTWWIVRDSKERHDTIHLSGSESERLAVAVKNVLNWMEGE